LKEKSKSKSKKMKRVKLNKQKEITVLYRMGVDMYGNRLDQSETASLVYHQVSRGSTRRISCSVVE
jgi:hypothetical protein